MSATANQAETPLLVDVVDGIATVTLNRPGQFNALSSALISELQSAFDRIAADPGVRVVVLAASGRGFCAGHDLKEIRAMAGVEEVEALFARCSRMMLTITRLPQPVIAKVHGLATAAGCQLVATCDLAVASESATFATPGVNIGAFCATPGVAVGRAVGRKHAMEMLLTGAAISAARAHDIGLVNRVVPAEALEAEVSDMAKLIATRSSSAIASGKAGFYRQLELSLDEAYAVAGHSIAREFFTEDGKEGVDAFLGKRAPRWPDRSQGAEVTKAEAATECRAAGAAPPARAGPAPRGEQQGTGAACEQEPDAGIAFGNGVRQAIHRDIDPAAGQGELRRGRAAGSRRARGRVRRGSIGPDGAIPGVFEDAGEHANGVRVVWHRHVRALGERWRASSSRPAIAYSRGEIADGGREMRIDTTHQLELGQPFVDPADRAERGCWLDPAGDASGARGQRGLEVGQRFGVAAQRLEEERRVVEPHHRRHGLRAKARHQRRSASTQLQS